jgi:uncharacterized protein (TIGR00288 family)
MSTERVMLLIDADNVSVDVMEQAVRLLMNQHGAVHVRRAYCTAEGAVKNQAAFKRLSIKPMVNLSAGKNSTDIALAVDAIDLVLAERPDVVVIASSDSDFAPLVARLREKGCVVRGIGQEGKTGEETQDAYDDFTVLAHRKGPAAASAASGAARAPARTRGAAGARATGRGTPASTQRPERAAEPRQEAPLESRQEVRPGPRQEAGGGKGSRGGKGGKGGNGGNGGDRPRTGAARPLAPTAHNLADDMAEDEAAAEATLALLRVATDRAAAQQAAALAEAAAPAAAAAALQPEPEAKAASKTRARRGKAAQTATVASDPPADPSAQKAPAQPLTAALNEAPTEPPTPARKSAPRKAPARKSAAKPTKATEAAASAPAGTRPANPKSLAAEVLATLSPPAASRPAPAAPAAQMAAPPARPPVPAPAARSQPPASAVAALPDKVLEILASLPELARGDTVELRLASQRLRDAGLLSKSGSSTKLLGQFGDRFELLPPGQPNHVRLRGGKLV